MQAGHVEVENLAHHRAVGLVPGHDLEAVLGQS